MSKNNSEKLGEKKMKMAKKMFPTDELDEKHPSKAKKKGAQAAKAKDSFDN